MSPAVRTLPDHGTLHRRKTYQCGCDACLACERDWTNTRSRLTAYGKWEPFTDAEPARQHVLDLMSYGIGWQRVARLAGVSTGGMSRLLYGAPTKGRPPNKRVRIATAEKILAVQPNPNDIAPSAIIDATGTRRRLQALVANGWPQMRLGRELGCDHPRLAWGQIRKERITAATARKVRDLYERLWDQRPEAHGVQDRYAEYARKIAAENGWPPPAAWDDDCIDDPAFTPEAPTEAPLSRDERAVERRDEIWLFHTAGLSDDEIAKRVGVSASTVHAIRAELRTGIKRDRSKKQAEVAA